MCGRFNLTSTPERLAHRFGLGEVPDLGPRFNISPSQDIATIRTRSDGVRVLEPRRWGLIPAWAKDPKVGFRMINARAETAAERPAYRKAFRLRRCLVPADGFYEWSGRSGAIATKQPYCIGVTDELPFAIAGLWERWNGPEDLVIESCTLLTTRANDRVAPVHDRMPVILEPRDYERWLDLELQDADSLVDLLRPFASDRMTLHPVSSRVNNPRYDDPSCAEPVPESQPALF
ncbi:MAG: SOS response-associated peptidase [Myxococcota bacterium]